MNAHANLARIYAENHPDIVARLAEAAPAEEFAELLQSLPAPVAAGVVDRASPLLAARALEHADAPVTARIYAQLDPRVAADLLRRGGEAAQHRTLEAVPKAARTHIEHLLHYGPQQAGSRMDPRAPAVAANASVSDALDQVRRSPAGALYYVYVTDPDQRLVGVVNMRELMLAQPEAQIRAIMTQRPDRLRASESLDAVCAHPAWQRVHALPVVEANERLVGALRYSAFRRIETERGQSRSGPVAARTAEALAELLWLGASAVARVAETTTLGTNTSEGRR